MNSAVYVYMTLSILYKPGNGACIMYIKTVFNKKTCGQAYLSSYLAHTHTHSHTLTHVHTSAQASCPIPEPGSIGSCIFACADNSSCPGSQLCCSNGCGRVCVNPVYTNVTVTCTGPSGRTYRPGETYTAADGCNTW